VPTVNKFRSAFLALGFPIDGDMFTEKTGSVFGHSWLAMEMPTHHVLVARSIGDLSWT
jgi:hypothetical protein